MSYSNVSPARLKTGIKLSTRIAIAAVSAVVALSAVSDPARANDKYAGIVIDANTGKTLYQNDADQYRYPASLTKMMTMYLIFEALDNRKVFKNTRITVSANAAAEQPSKLGLRRGQTITIEQVILSLVTRSANDAATAVAEYLGGSEAGFARMMTQKARQLGMSRTTFKNAHGLPNSAQRTTARDMARLGIALREHYPQYYSYFSTRSFRYGKAVIGNHNRLLGKVRGVDGIKTGYTRASGYNLVSSVKTGGRSIVAVVMGGRSGASRNAQMQKLIAQYLPKASRRDGGDLIAKGPVLSRLAAVSLPKIGPTPDFRNPGDVRIALAYAAPSSKEFPMPSNRPVIGRQALADTLRKQRAAVVPQPALIAQSAAPVPPAAVGDANGVDPVVTASTAPAPSGWVVQIGAMPAERDAIALLRKAQTSAGRAVSDARPFTMAYQKNGATLYRARFAGFDGKGDAWAACASLKKKGYGCWATQQ